MLKRDLLEIRAFSTMRRFIVMRQDDIQSLVATPPPSSNSVHEREENVWKTSMGSYLEHCSHVNKRFTKK